MSRNTPAKNTKPAVKTEPKAEPVKDEPVDRPAEMLRSMAPLQRGGPATHWTVTEKDVQDGAPSPDLADA